MKLTHDFTKSKQLSTMISTGKKAIIQSVITLIIMTLVMNVADCQLFQIDGQAKIMDMVEQNNCDSIVVRTTDGTLAIRHASTLGGGGTQTISIDRSTITLSDGGGSINLPPDAVNDSDADPANELQNLSFNGDTIFIENKNFIVLPGLKNLTYLNTSVQERLNRGASPIQIYQNGFPLDSIYGRMYKGGLIFYIDPLDEIPGVEGLVADVADINVTGDYQHPWGCLSTDPLPYPTGNSIGQGAANTDSIVMNGCAGAGDAGILADGHTSSTLSDWYLPSKEELEAMYHHIGQGASGPNQNIGNFDMDKYWSSTPSDDNGTWHVDFSSGSVTGFLRSSELKVRAVRSF